ncbi:MAG: PaaD protein [Zetaproteobacteria bacterium]|nr:MAG: PaaD protein [Zetaproteobacteria bacterium]
MIENKTQSDDSLEHLAEPPHVEATREHALWPQILKGLKEIYDPEIPVNIYELGLIYKVDILPEENGVCDVEVKMSLTSPACPVAQEMPSWVQGAILPIEGVGGCEVEIIWEPQWNPSMMAETAKMQLNMFM